MGNNRQTCKKWRVLQKPKTSYDISYLAGMRSGKYSHPPTWRLASKVGQRYFTRYQNCWLSSAPHLYPLSISNHRKHYISKQLFAVKPHRMVCKTKHGTKAGCRIDFQFLVMQDKHTQLMKHPNSSKTVFETVKHQGEGSMAINQSINIFSVRWQ